MLFEYPQVWPSAQHSLCARPCSALPVRRARDRPRLVRDPHAAAGSPALLEYAIVLPLGIPGIALGIGILSAWILVPGGIYGTLWILLLAYITAHIPVAMQFVASALHRIHTDLEDASRIAGQSSARNDPAHRPATDAPGADRQLAVDLCGDPARDLARHPALQPERRWCFRSASWTCGRAGSIRNWRSIRCCSSCSAWCRCAAALEVRTVQPA